MALECGTKAIGQRWIKNIDGIGELAVVLHFAEENRTIHAGRREAFDLVERHEVAVVGAEAIAGGVADGDEAGDRKSRDD